MATSTNATPADREHPAFARIWAASMRRCQPRSIKEHRAALVRGLEGVVVEVGCGSGSTFPYYGAGVARVIAIEPEPYLRRQAERAAQRAPVPVEVRAGLAEALPLDADSVDAAVCSLVLCSVPDQGAALAEIARVVRPGGELRYYEHVAEPEGTTSRRAQEWLDRTGLWAKAGGGCHVARQTGDAIRAAGFTIEQEQTQTLGPPLVVPVRRHLLGTARLAG